MLPSGFHALVLYIFYALINEVTTNLRPVIILNLHLMCFALAGHLGLRYRLQLDARGVGWGGGSVRVAVVAGVTFYCWDTWVIKNKTKQNQTH